MKYELQAMSVGGILDRALRLYIRNFGILLAISLAFLVPVAVLYLFLSHQVGGSDMEQTLLSSLVGLTVNVGVQALLAGALVQAVSDIYLGLPVSMGRCFRSVGSRFLPLVLATICYSAIVGAATMACILPGLYFMGALFATIPAVVLERKGAFEAIGRSWTLSWSMRRRAFGATFFSNSIGAMVGAPVGFVAGILELRPMETQAITQVVTALVIPYASIVLILLYYDFRIRREAFDLQVLAAELHRGPPAP